MKEVSRSAFVIVPEKELCSTILMLALEKKIAGSKGSKGLVPALAEITLPKVNKKVVEKIQKAVKGGAKESDAVLGAGLVLPMTVPAVTALYECASMHDLPGAAYIIACFWYLSWKFLGETGRSEAITKMLLAIFRRLGLADVNDRVRQVAFSCYQCMYDIHMVTKAGTIDFVPYIEEFAEMICSEPVYPVGYYDVLVKLAHVFMDKVEVESARFLELMIDIMKNRGNMFPRKILDLILTSGCDGVNLFGAKWIKFLVAVVEMFGAEAVKPPTALIPASIGKMVEMGSIMNVRSSKKPENIISLPDRTPKEFQPVVTEYKTLENEFTVERPWKLPKRLPLETLLRDDVKEKLNELVQAIIGNVLFTRAVLGAYRTFFAKYVASHEYVYDIFAAHLYTLREIRGHVNAITPLEVVGHKQLFDPAFTAFGPPDDWPVLNTLRGVAADLIKKSGIRGVAAVLSTMIKTPMLFSEIVYRIVPKTGCLGVARNEIPVLARMVFVPMSYYQTLESSDSDVLVAVSRARCSLFALIESFFRKDVMFQWIMQDSSFVRDWMSLIFEIPVKPLILEIITRFFSKGLCTSISAFTTRILEIICELCTSLSDPQTVLLVTDLMNVLSKYMGTNEGMPLTFRDVGGYVLGSLFMLPVAEHREITEGFMSSLMALMASTVSARRVELGDVSVLSTAAQRIWGNNPPESFYLQILQWSAGSQDVTRDTPFKMCCARPLIILFEVYTDVQHLKDVLALVKNIATFDDGNLQELQDKQIDRCVLGIPQKYWNSNEVDNELIQAAYDLFKVISDSKSYVSAVQQFISLLCPIDGKILPVFHRATLNTLSELLSNADRRSVPFSANVQFSVTGMTVDQLKGGCTVFFDVLPECQAVGYGMWLVRMVDPIKQRISIGITDGSVVIEMEDSSGNEKRIEREMKFTVGEWSSIAVSIDTQSDGNTLRIRHFGKSDEYESYSEEFVGLQPGDLKVTLGGVSSSLCAPEKEWRFSSAALFPFLQDGMVLRMCSEGSVPPIVLDKAHFFMRAHITGLQNILRRPDITCSERYKLTVSMSFADTLVDLCGVDLILPLFAQWGFAFRDESTFPELPQTVMTIFETAITRSEDGQRRFFKKDGVTILSCLLQRSECHYMTYETYLFLYHVFTLLTDVKLKRCFLAVLLTDIWFVKDIPDQVRSRVMQHWETTLFLNHTEVAAEAHPLSWALNALQTYMLDLPDQKKDNEIALQMRHIFRNIAVAIGLKRVRKIDMIDLTASIITSGEEEVVLDMLHILKRLVTAPNTPLKKGSDCVKQLGMLFFLGRHEADAVAVSALDVIAVCAKAKLFGKLGTQTVVDIFMNQLPPEAITKSRLAMFMDKLVVGNDDLFPICTWMAFNMGDKFAAHVYSTLAPKVGYYTSRFSTIWSVIACFYLDRTTAKSIIRFLIRSSMDQYGWLYGAFEVMGLVIGSKEQTSDFLGILLWEYTQALITPTEPEKNALLRYFLYVRHYLFLQSSDEDYRLQRMLEESPFANALMKKKKSIRRVSRHSIESLLSESEEAQTQTNAMLSAMARDRRSMRRGTLMGRRLSKCMSIQRVGWDLPCLEMSNSGIIRLVRLMPGGLDQKLAEFLDTEIVYHFGIRRDEDGAWKDLDFAENAVKLFLRYPHSELVSTVLTIAAMMLHWNPELAESLGEQVKDRLGVVGSEASAYYDYHALATGRKLINPDMEPGERECKRFNYLESFISDSDMTVSAMANEYLQRLIKVRETNNSFLERYRKLVNSRVQEVSVNMQAEFAEGIDTLYTNAYRRWTRFLRCVTIERAPWRNSLPASSIRQQHFKRDFSVSETGFYPKMKVNMNFNIHAEASRIRDDGSLMPSQSQDAFVNETTRKLEEEYMNAEDMMFELADESGEKEHEEVSFTTNDCILDVPCELVKLGSYINGNFILESDNIILVRSDKRTRVIPLSTVVLVVGRTRYHHPKAIEIFANDGKSWFVSFPDHKAKVILRKFRNVNQKYKIMIQAGEFKSAFEARKWTEKWQNREITTFQYLFLLNFGSGRSFNDLSQYPVYPWIIQDYQSTAIDLDSPQTYRDLSKPVGALSEERLAESLEKKEQLVSAGLSPYLYGAGYSCSLAVSLWLMRFEPFTSIHIDIQGGRFDHAARLFGSLDEAWHQVSTAHNDYRELVPEFFCMPEFLQNKDGFDLGSFQDRKVGDVILPPWASSAIEFVYLNRKALESDHVSNNIEKWIDLIWGVNQSGHRAEVANNIFKRELYYNIWNVVDGGDPAVRAEVEALLMHIGQIPPPLFDKPHVKRLPRKQPNMYNANKIVSLAPKGLVAASIVVSEHNVVIHFMNDDCMYQVRTFTPSTVMANDNKKIGRFPSETFITMGQFPAKPQRLSRGRLPVRDFSLGNMSSFEEEKCYVFSGDGFDSVGDQQHELITTKSAGNTTKLKHKSDIVFSAVDGSWTLVADRHSSFSMYQGGKRVYSVPIFTSAVDAACINSNMGIVVCGTHDRSLMFCSLTKGYVNRIINLGRIPTRVISTPSWGFVLVCSSGLEDGRFSNWISLFTINGDPIRELEIEACVESWSTFSTDTGLDYIVLATDDRECYVFEAFYLDLSMSVYTSTDPVVATAFLPSESVAVFVTKDGNAAFVPVVMRS